MSLGHRALRGTLWLSVANYTAYFVTFGTDILLARLLRPEDFGVVALAVSILAMLKALSSFGLSSAIIQYQPVDKADENRFLGTVFSVAVIISLSVLVIILFAAYILQYFYSYSVILVLVVLAIGTSFQTISHIPGTLIQKRMLFRQEGILRVISLFASSILGIILAFNGLGYWSLVAKQLSNIAINASGNWYIAQWRPILAWNHASLHHIWYYAKNMWVVGNIQSALNRIDDIAVGTINGVEALGFYSRAYKLSRLFVEFIAPAIGRVTLPVYSRLQNDPQALASVFGITYRSLARMSALFYLEVGLLAPQLILVFYGKQWLPAVAIFQVMLIYAFLYPLLGQYTVLFVATKRPGILARLRVVQLLFFLPAVYIAALFWGTIGVAWVMNLTILLGTFLANRETLKIIEHSIVKAAGPSVISACATTVLVLYLPTFLSVENIWVDVLLKAVFTATMFSSILLLLERRTLLRDINRVRTGMFNKKV
ncbi:oligosaccharide flippase family protein [Anaerolineales bacterium HSG24]|nr:oligosaccharide flippase family protein [Anaerolineales bacterium HSG24]